MLSIRRNVSLKRANFINLIAQKEFNPAFKRFMSRFPLESDINITKAGKTLITAGAGGRSSRTGYTATVFGSTGFLGRFLVAKLAKHGTITVCPYRNEYAKRQLKVNGDLGVVNFIELDIRNIKSIEDSLVHSDIVYNLIGSDQWTKNFSMADTNIEATKRIAELVKKHEIPRFIQVSSYNADPKSESVFYATKGIAEQIAKDIVPDVTIVRPAPMYGRNSGFLNELLPLQGLGSNILFQKKVYPTHGIQVAEALSRIGFDDSTAGQTFELYGPEQYSKAELREMLKYVRHLDMSGYFTAAVGYDMPIPEFALKIYANMMRYLSPNLTALNPDKVTRAKIDQFIDPSAKTYADLDLVPDELDDYLYKYVKAHINASSQSKNRTVYDKEELQKLRMYVNDPKGSPGFSNLRG